MSDIENKVNQCDHDYLQEQVWELQHALEKLREEFEDFKNRFIGDGK